MAPDTIYIQPERVIMPDGEREGWAVVVRRGLIAEVGAANEVPRPQGARVLEADGMILSPGFIDLQLNGGFGHDFTADPGSMWEVARQLLQHGVTSFLPTIITSPAERIKEAQEVWSKGPPPGFVGAVPLGLHLEGPFLNPAKKGAHNPAYLRLPDIAMVSDWSPENGVRLVTLAPELAGADEVISILTQRSVRVSAGHSMATVEEGRSAIRAGVTYGTHLFNAMPALGHREPGLAGALLEAEQVVAGIIADGIHADPLMVKLAWRLKGRHGLNLVTDAMAALGMPPGGYALGDGEAVSDGAAVRRVDGTLAGSVLSMDRAVRNLALYTGCETHEAICAATSMPAQLLGIDRERGRIAQGCRADLVLLTPELRVASTIVGGAVVSR